MANNKHADNLQSYLSFGGNPRIAKLYASPTLANRAKIVYLLSEIRNSSTKKDCSEKVLKSEKSTYGTVIDPTSSSYPKANFIGLVAQYPLILHPVYNRAYNTWLTACSLKIQLNNVLPEDSENALNIQVEIFKLMDAFDADKEVLDYYLHYKRVLIPKESSTIKQLNPISLVTTRNSLRSNITRRKQTLEKRIGELPETSDPSYKKKINFILNKREELKALEIELAQLNSKIENFATNEPN